MLFSVGYIRYFYRFNVWKRLKSHFGCVDQTGGSQASGQNPEHKTAAVLTHVDLKFINPERKRSFRLMIWLGGQMAGGIHNILYYIYTVLYLSQLSCMNWTSKLK